MFIPQSLTETPLSEGTEDEPVDKCGQTAVFLDDSEHLEVASALRQRGKTVTVIFRTS